MTDWGLKPETAEHVHLQVWNWKPVSIAGPEQQRLFGPSY